MGADYAGIVGSDRYSAYNWLDPLKRQVCWAHLIRDFQALVERGGESTTIGRLLLAQVKQMFSWWQRVRDGILARADFQAAMQSIRKEVSALLHIGTFVTHVVTRRTCRNILKVEQALWTFVDRESVEPTNNAAPGPVGHTELEPLNLTAVEMAPLEAFLRALSGPLSVPPELLQAPR